MVSIYDTAVLCYIMSHTMLRTAIVYEVYIRYSGSDSVDVCNVLFFVNDCSLSWLLLLCGMVYDVWYMWYDVCCMVYGVC